MTVGHMAGKKVLIIRFSSIGDIVLTTPIVRCLKAQRGAEIHYVCKQGFASILSSNPHIDKLFTFQHSIREVLGALRAEDYDCVIDLHKNLRSHRLRWLLRKPAHSFDKLNWQKWLAVTLKHHRLPDVHIVDRYFRAVAPLGVVNDGRGLDYIIPPETAATLPHGIPSSDYICLAVGGAHFTKRIPAETCIDICRSTALPIVLLGGQADVEKSQSIEKETAGKAINMCGVLSLHQSAEVIRRSAFLITSDTGLMHIGAALNKGMAVLWGNTIPAFGMYAYYGDRTNTAVNFEVSDLSCRPCSKIGKTYCPRGHFRCMTGISANDVISTMNATIARNSAL